MTNIEQKIITKIIKSLRTVANANFTKGDVYQWSKFGREMQTTIRTNINILDGLIELPPTVDEDESKQDLTKILP